LIPNRRKDQILHQARPVCDQHSDFLHDPLRAGQYLLFSAKK
jgi:hypothetical protein